MVGLVVSETRLAQARSIDDERRPGRAWTNKLDLRDGRTTAEDLELGTHGHHIEQWYKEREGKNQPNYGQAVAHEFARTKVLDGFQGA